MVDRYTVGVTAGSAFDLAADGRPRWVAGRAELYAAVDVTGSHACQ